MAQIAKASKSTAKKVAYEKKQEEGGKKILEWIFGVLIVLAILFVIYSIWVAATSNKVTSAVVTDALSGCVSVTTAVTSPSKVLRMRRA